jgi:pimeloyl-ACP methyl ester carboxylesterase
MPMRRLLAPVVATLLVSLSPLAVAAQPWSSAESSVSIITPPRFADVQLRTGVRLRYAEQGDPQGEKVILLHGLTDSWFSFSRVMPLMPTSWHVFALDQRGQGESDRPASGYTMADLGDDVLAFMDTMGIREATIVGHSMGSFVAQRVAITAPERVRRLVLIGSATTVHNEVVHALRDELANMADPMPRQFLHDFQYGTIYKKVPDAFMNRVIAESEKVSARIAYALLEGMMASGDSSRLSAIRVPTLIMWGEHDAVFPRSEQALLQDRIAGSELRVYADVGHAPHWEVPESVVADLEAFFSRRGEN